MNRSERIAVIGCGWLGQPLAQLLQKQGYHVIGTTTRESKRSELQKARIEAEVLLLAADGSSAVPEKVIQSSHWILNTPPLKDGFDHALTKAVDEGARGSLKKIIFISSTSVYDEFQGRVDESSPLLGHGGNAEALKRAEKALTLRSDIATTILRPGGLFGAGRHPARFLAGRKDVPNPSGFVHLVHRDDVIAAIAAVLARGVWGETINLVWDERPSRKDYYTHEARRLNLPPPDFAPAAAEPANHRWIDNAKAKMLLGLDFVHSEGLVPERG